VPNLDDEFSRLQELTKRQLAKHKLRDHLLVARTNHCTKQETKMKFALIGAVAVAAAAFATPALAQQVIEDPGYCAQFYPNANCQNQGPGNPYTDGNWRNGNAYNAYPAPRMVHHRHPTHRG
jgi:hypothetical protein